MLQRVTLGMILLLAGATGPMAGQVTISVDQGQRVRVWSAQLGLERQEATIVALVPDTLVMEWLDPLHPPRLPLSYLDRLERRSPRSAGSGAALGALFGLLIGGTAGFLVGNELSNRADCADDCGLARRALTATGLLAGPLAGAVVGAVWPGEHWEGVPLQEVPAPLGSAR